MDFASGCVDVSGRHYGCTLTEENNRLRANKSLHSDQHPQGRRNIARLFLGMYKLSMLFIPGSELPENSEELHTLESNVLYPLK